MSNESWQKTEELTLTIVDGESEQEYKLIFGSINTYEKALYSKYRTRAFGLVADEYAERVTLPDTHAALNDIARYVEVVKLLPAFEADRAESKMNAMILHAVGLASLKQVWLKQGETWVRGHLPAFWYDLSQAVEQIPTDIADAFTNAPFVVNPPRVFNFVGDSDGEKKMLHMIVRPSVSLPNT